MVTITYILQFAVLFIYTTGYTGGNVDPCSDHFSCTGTKYPNKSLVRETYKDGCFSKPRQKFRFSGLVSYKVY